MSQTIVINAEARADVGKGASRRLRRDGVQVPAILYGGEQPPVNLALNYRELAKAMQSEAFYSQVLQLNTPDGAQSAIVKDVQRHPASEFVIHMDFQRVRADQPVEVHVPLHFINEAACVGVKDGGGAIRHALNEVIVRALPGQLPEFIEIDVINLNVGDSLHLSDLKLPEGVELVELSLGEDHDLAVVSVQAPRGGTDAEDEDTEADSEDEQD